MTIIHCEKLCRNYGERRGVVDIDLQIDRGEIFGFLGPNGAGKSTTIRLLLGFLKPSTGTAQIFGQDCWSNSRQIKEQVGYVPGDVRLYPWMTARRAFNIVSRIHGRDLHAAGEKLAERFRLESNLPVRKMSRGNRQKVSLVLSMIHDPQLLVLDEPTSGLDPLMQDELADCLREYANEGRTIFFSSHTLSEVEDLCDQVAVVRDGQVVANETIQQMKSRAPRVVTIEFDNDVDVLEIVWPTFLSFEQQRGQRCELQMTGAAEQLLDWLKDQRVKDLEVSAPSLDVLFRGYYSSATDNAA